MKASSKNPATKLILALAIAGILPLLNGSLMSQEVEPGFKSLFNGKDLTGWGGRTNHWSVEQGAITGTTSKENPAKGNDFELRLSYRFSSDWGNSGIQYRSADKGNHVVHGYQADMEVGKDYSGILYEEGGRGILAKRGEKVVIRAHAEKAGKHKIEVTGSVGVSSEIQAAIKAGDWNDYVVVAKGNHLQHFINGKQTVDVTDEHEAKAARSGILALQIHAGPAMKVQFKNIRIKSLK